MTTIFTDAKTGTPLFTCELEEGYQTQTLFEAFSRDGITTELQYKGMAANKMPSFFFESGHSYIWQNTADMAVGKVNETGAICLPFCTLAEQMTGIVSEFVQGNAQAMGYYDLPASRQEKVQKEGSAQIERNYQELVKASQFSQVPVQLNVSGWIMDGAIGVYPCLMKGAKKTVYCAFWRIGMHVSFTVPAMMSFGQPGINSSAWTTPLVLFMISDQDPNEEDLKRMAKFADTLDLTPQFAEYSARVEESNRQNVLQESARRAQENQMMINQMWAMHNAAWDRVEAQRNALSADLDAFRAGLNQQMAANDAWRDQMFSPTPSSFNPSESVDDRIQRMRHESIMGVNTYDREDGTTYEHTIMNDRVFENNLDSSMHFGTENWLGDNIPDGWTELFRRK